MQIICVGINPYLTLVAKLDFALMESGNKYVIKIDHPLRVGLNLYLTLVAELVDVLMVHGNKFAIKINT